VRSIHLYISLPILAWLSYHLTKGDAAELDKKLPRLKKLISKKKITDSVREFTFATTNPNSCINLPCGQHVCLRFKAEDGEKIVRKYTPTVYDTPGSFKILMKIYDGGKMGNYLENRKIGDYVEMTGPVGLITYEGNGVFKQGRREIKCDHLCLVAGGTGLTPMYQIVSHLGKHLEDSLMVTILVACSTVDDILLEKELRALNKDPRINVRWTISRPNEDWRGFKGRINASMFEEVFPKRNDGVVVGYCGPPKFEKVCKTIFKEKGYKSGMDLFRW